jgi:hypothetical protein
LSGTKRISPSRTAASAGSVIALRPPGPGLPSTRVFAGEIEKPLVGQHRLDHRIGALADRHLQLVLFGFHQQAEGFEIGEHGLACGKAIEPAIFLGRVVVDLGIKTQHGDWCELVACANLPVIEIMRRCDLHAAGAEFALDVVIGNHRNLAPGQRQLSVLPISAW